MSSWLSYLNPLSYFWSSPADQTDQNETYDPQFELIGDTVWDRRKFISEKLAEKNLKFRNDSKLLRSFCNNGLVGLREILGKEATIEMMINNIEETQYLYQYTFYARIKKNPQKYNLSKKADQETIRNKAIKLWYDYQKENLTKEQILEKSPHNFKKIIENFE